MRALRALALVMSPLMTACAGGAGGPGGHDAAAGQDAGGTGAAGTTGTGAAGTGAAGTGAAGTGAAGTGAAGTGAAGTGAAGTGGGAGGAGGAPVSPCITPGWCPLPNTKLKSVCPTVSPGGATGCAGVVEAWSGGIADTAGNRLIVWGGGHNDYWGNEVYVLDLGTRKLSRLNEPSPPTNVASCPETLPDGTPSSRHTYNGLAYLAQANRLFSFGGSKSSCGFLGTGTWTLDLATLKWTSMDPHKGGTPAGNPGVVADTDPATHLVFLHDGAAFWQYDFDTNTYTKLKDNVSIDYHLNAVIDPKRKVFVMLGGNEAHIISIAPGSTYAMSSPTLTGCAALTSAGYPGLAYDSKRDRIVGWAGGDSVTVLNMDTMSCTAVTNTGGPGPQRQAGTNGRWRYFPALDVFAVVNAWDADSFALRLP